VSRAQDPQAGQDVRRRASNRVRD